MTKLPRASLIFIVSILLAAFIVRVYKVGEVPDGLFCDEAAMGYNAFALGKWGIDENGEFMPLFIWSFGGYKNPVYIYSAIFPTLALGLSEFSLRLTSVIYGTLSIGAVFFLARELWGLRAGLAAAFFLAMLPWHFHFSRVAFELISFPFLFLAGFTLLIKGVNDSGRGWNWAAIFFGLTFFSYAISALFVPLFLFFFGLLYWHKIWQFKRRAVVAICILSLFLLRFALFQYQSVRSSDYFRGTTWIYSDASIVQKIETFWNHYRQFFSMSFLFEQGDPVLRHAVQGYGVIHMSMLPLIAIGVVSVCVRINRLNIMILIWTLLYPVGASLMNEIPTASRAFIGSPLPALFAACGFSTLCQVLGRIPIAAVRTFIVTGVYLATGIFVGLDMHRYLAIYFGKYREMSARGIAGFQYGYRDVIRYMEDHKSEYKQFITTATDVNQPYIFVNFYTQIDPITWSTTNRNGYIELVPQEYSRYDLTIPTLYAVREHELSFFEDYEIKHKVVGPDGVIEFVIIHPKSRKEYLTKWAALGLFRDTGKVFFGTPPLSPRQLSASYSGVGTIRWQLMKNQMVTLDFNSYFRNADPQYPSNPEYACAYISTQIRSEIDRKVFLILAGSEDRLDIWLNGSNILASSYLKRNVPERVEIDLLSKWNELIIRTCEETGDWFVAAYLADSAGKNLKGIEIEAFPPPSLLETKHRPMPETLEATPSLSESVSIFEGFSAATVYSHQDKNYGDYRGGTNSYWAYLSSNPPLLQWVTESVSKSGSIVFAFTASSGEDPGIAELSLNNQRVARFKIGTKDGELLWHADGYNLTYVHRQLVSGYSGYYLLLVPPGELDVGKSAEITVNILEGGDTTWFMIKGYNDTVTYENIKEQATVYLDQGIKLPAAERPSANTH